MATTGARRVRMQISWGGDWMVSKHRLLPRVGSIRCPHPHVRQGIQDVCVSKTGVNGRGFAQESDDPKIAFLSILRILCRFIEIFQILFIKLLYDEILVVGAF